MVTDLTTGNVAVLLLQFAFPLFISNALQAVYNIVDMVVVGQYIGGAGMSAVSIGGDILHLLTFVAMGFSSAGQVIVARDVGAGRMDRVQKTIGTMFTFLLGTALVISVGSFFIRSNILDLLNTPTESYIFTMDYMVTCLVGLVFIYGYNIVSAILRGMGDSRRPFVFIAIAAVVNMILDVLFVAYMDMEVFGAAFATVISQAISFIFALVYLYKGFGIPGKLVILAFIPVFILMINSLYVKDKTRFDKFANLYTAILYIAVPWSLLNFAVFGPDGTFNGRLLLCFFCIIWGSDVGAYGFGMALGQKYGKKLFPSISPKKSWIGFWGGMFTAIAVSVILYFTGIFPLNAGNQMFNLLHCIAIAVLLDIAGVYGDLIESQWKRHYNVKDSGSLIPGHGGLLDRFDSALIAIPIGIIYLVTLNALCL